MFNLNEFNFEILSVHALSWDKQFNYAYPRPYHAISLRIKGDADFLHDDKRYSVKENELIFVPKNYGYTLHSKTSEKVIVIHFDSPSEYGEIQTFSPTDPEIFTSLFQQAVKVYSSRAVGYKHKLYALFYEILQNVELQQDKSYALKYDVSEQFQKSVDYIRSNFSDSSLTIEELAKNCNVSATYFRKIFKKLMHVSPLKFLNDIRLSRARTLLKTGYYTVEQVAYDCGFNDSKYFSTCYKHKYGNSPGKDVEKLFKKI